MSNHTLSVAESDSCAVIEDECGHRLTPNQIADLCEKLMSWAIDHSEDIDQYNDFVDEELNKVECYVYTHGKDSPTARPTSLYLMECLGRYKIGVSDDVKKRCKQLRSRQFPVRIIASSSPLAWAFDIERDLHDAHKDKCVGGEWFEFSEREAECVASLISNISDMDYELGL